jgi:hypothetical protein
MKNWIQGFVVGLLLAGLLAGPTQASFAPSTIKSMQSGTLSINAGGTTGTSAISAVDTAKAVIIPQGGHNSASADPNFNIFFNSTTQIGANRVISSGNTVIRYTVVEFY